MILPVGFHLGRKLFSRVKLERVTEAIAWEQKTIKVFGREHNIPRLTAWYGTESYTYSGIRHEPRPMPVPVADIHEAISVLGAGIVFNSVLCNLYRGGSDSVSWHADDEPELGPEPAIVSISLGASRKFSIKSRMTGERTDVVLEHGDILIMSGRSQLDYLHAIPKTAHLPGPRVNLTFRRVQPDITS